MSNGAVTGSYGMAYGTAKAYHHQKKTYTLTRGIAGLIMQEEFTKYFDGEFDGGILIKGKTTWAKFSIRH